MRDVKIFLERHFTEAVAPRKEMNNPNIWKFQSSCSKLKKKKEETMQY